MAFFRIKNLTPAMDGLFVEGKEHDLLVDTVTVTRIVNRNAIVGDRNVSYPVKDGGLHIDAGHLERVEDFENREFDSKNPWGACLFEGRYVKKDIDVAYAKYEKATQVTVSEKRDGKLRTLMSKYFMGEDAFDRVIPEIESVLSGETDADDLVFELEDID